MKAGGLDRDFEMTGRGIMQRENLEGHAAGRGIMQRANCRMYSGADLAAGRVKGGTEVPPHQT
jgi:hypothetical protein